ncbi:MAG: hypothetical protein JOZ39_04420, partial [Chloroflexi bacterium]|nr:hypothetical protein [Chloroflexota bacterium]
MTSSGSGEGPAPLRRLDPWSEPPLQRLWSLATPATWRRLAAVPMGLEVRRGIETAVVACAGEPAGSVRRELEAAVRRPVAIFLAPRDTVYYWLEVLDGGDVMLALDRYLKGLMADLGLDRGQSSLRLPSAGDAERLPISAIRDAYGLSDVVTVELLSLASGRPWVRPEKYSLDSRFARFIPEPRARHFRAVAVAAHAGHVVVASDRVWAARWRREFEADLGLALRLCLCTPASLDQTLSKVYGHELLDLDEPADEAIVATLAGRGALDSTHVAAINRLSGVTGEGRVAVALRLGYISDAQLLAARAALLGAKPLEPRAEIDRERARFGAPVVWRRWGCVPVRHGHEHLLASTRLLSDEALEACALVTGASTAPRLCSPDALARLQNNLPALEPGEYTALDHLRATGQVVIDSSDYREAMHEVDRSDTTPLAALASTGAIDRWQAVESSAVAETRAWITLDRFRGAPAVLERLPRE